MFTGAVVGVGGTCVGVLGRGVGERVGVGVRVGVPDKAPRGTQQ